MKTNRSLHSPAVRSALARAILESRQFVRKYKPDESRKRIVGDHNFTLGYFTQAIDNALFEKEKGGSNP